ncbi:dnaJ, partial [Symbiodinium sp. CCMP2456]
MSLGHTSAGSLLARAAALGGALLGCHLAKETLAWVGISSPEGACSVFVSHRGPYSRPPGRMLRRAQGRDPFTVLGVESSATRDEVKK